MKKVLVLVLMLMVLWLWTCDSPTEPKHNSYEQHQIPWPSLADTPWPIWRGNPMGNGLSFVNGPTKGRILWKYTPDYPTANRSLGLVIDSTGNIYTMAQTLISLSPSGKLRWSLELEGSWIDWSQPTPLVLRGNRIAACVGEHFYIIDTTGKITKESILPQPIINAGFQVDKNGRFYATFYDGTVKAFDSDGNIYWETVNKDYEGYSTGHVPFFLPDGQAFVISNVISIQKININGTVEWVHPTKLASTISISSEGFIYYVDDGDTTLNCLDPSGKLIWKTTYQYNFVAPLAQSCILSDGTILFAGKLMLALSPEGKELWRFLSLGSPYYAIHSDLVCDINGNVFGLSFDDYYLYSIGANGKLNWTVEIGAYSPGSPCMDNGVLYLSEYSGGGIYAIE